MEKYFTHLQTCNKMQDWTEAQQAMSDTPHLFMDEGYRLACEEMNQKMNTCTCGMEECLKDVKGNYFTPDQIRKVQELAYDAGYEACKENHDIDHN